MASITSALSQYFSSAKNLETVEEIQAFAQTMSDSSDSFSWFGNSSPATWGAEALRIIKNSLKPGGTGGVPGYHNRNDSQGVSYSLSISDHNALTGPTNALFHEGRDEAAWALMDETLHSQGIPAEERLIQQTIAWLAGAKQAYTRDRFLSRAGDNWDDFLDDLTNKQENVANLTDFSGVSEEEAQKVLEGEGYQDHSEKLESSLNALNSISPFLETLGVKIPEFNLQRDAQGNFVNSFYEGQEPAETSGVPGGTGTDLSDATLVEQSDDGTYSITNAGTGETLEGGFSSIQEALARQTQLKVGGTPQLTGAPDVFAIEPLESEVIEPYTLPDGTQVDTRVATPDELTGDAPIQTALDPDSLVDPTTTTEGEQATLVNEAGETMVVEVGSQAAQDAFGQGFSLPPTGGVIPSGTAGATSSAPLIPSSIPSQVSSLLAPVATDTTSLIPSREQTLQQVAGEYGVDVGENVQALTTVGEGIQTQETALRELESTILERSEGVGITQGQLNRLTATEAEPIAQALKDLLTSRSLLQNELAMISTETSAREASNLARFGLFTDLLSQQGLTIDPFTGQTVETLAAETTRTGAGQSLVAGLIESGIDLSQLGTDAVSRMLETGQLTTEDAISVGSLYREANDVPEWQQVEIDGELYRLDIESGTMEPLTGLSFDVPEGSTVDTSLGTGTITAYGSDLWEHGLDIQLGGGLGAPITLPFAFEVTDVLSEAESNGFGNQVKVRNVENGQEMWLSHLDEVSVGPGSYNPGTSIGTQGNTGDTVGPTGVHVDVTMPKPDGSFYSPEQVAGFLGVGANGTMGEAETDYNNALGFMLPFLPSTRQTPTQTTFDSITASGNEVLMQDFLLSTAKNTMTADAKNNITTKETLLNSLETIRGYLDTLEERGIDTGFLLGTEDDILARVGRTADPDVRYLQTLIANNVIAFRRAATGVQFNEVEQRQYAQMFPGGDKIQEVNSANLDALTDSMQDEVAGLYIGQMGETNFNNIFGDMFSPVGLPSQQNQQISESGVTNTLTGRTTSSGYSLTTEDVSQLVGEVMSLSGTYSAEDIAQLLNDYLANN